MYNQNVVFGNFFTYGVTGETECDFEDTLPTLIVLYLLFFPELDKGLV